MKNIEKRIPEFDGIRGIAIIMVILWHYFNNHIIEDGNFIGSYLKIFTRLCWSGVDLFFVLSGFLIGNILLKNKGSGNYFKTFYARRILRIFPIYFVVIFVFCIFLLIPSFQKYFPDLFIDNSIPLGSYFLYCQNYFMGIYGSFGARWLDVTWSLAIEEQFYIILPLMVYLIGDKKLFFIIVVFIIIAPIFRFYSNNWLQMQVFFQCRMDSLFTGVILALILLNPYAKDIVFKYKKIILFTFLIFLIGFILLIFRINFIPFFLHYSWFNILYGILILVIIVTKMSLIKIITKNKFIRKIGIISYGIYLLHQIIYVFVSKVYVNYFGNIRNNFQVILLGLTAFAITYILAYISYNLFENKMIKIGHSFKY